MATYLCVSLKSIPVRVSPAGSFAVEEKTNFCAKNHLFLVSCVSQLLRLVWQGPKFFNNLSQLDQQQGATVERLIDPSNPKGITALESKIAKFKEDKLLLADQAGQKHNQSAVQARFSNF